MLQRNRLPVFFAISLVFSLPKAVHAESITVNGPWYEFSFAQVGQDASGCFPADANGIDCIPSPSGNSVSAGTAPWVYTSQSDTVLTVTDVSLRGDAFEVFDNGVSIGTTPTVATGGGCGDDPVPCLADPLVSHKSFLLAPGNSSIAIQPTAILAPGSAYFQVETVPEPSTIFLNAIGLPAFFALSRKQRPPGKKRGEAP
ncbi:MAG: PEP-CTERM sorting domain-containing protein [Chroococcidiopsidaceae cyanobacterium CP_BM_ER_R8_30]|nr:PEP-CTERM sorting domain-containing protein [Chroococcidiopsidaceae cyanobacterium CP_BM_ER_R8_30]